MNALLPAPCTNTIRTLSSAAQHRYLTHYPEADVECRFLDRVVDMIDEGIDVAVRIGALRDSSYQAIRVGTVRRLVCASPAYLEARGMPLTPVDLAPHDIVSARGITLQSTGVSRRMAQGLTAGASPAFEHHE